MPKTIAKTPKKVSEIAVASAQVKPTKSNQIPNSSVIIMSLLIVNGCEYSTNSPASQ